MPDNNDPIDPDEWTQELTDQDTGEVQLTKREPSSPTTQLKGFLTARMPQLIQWAGDRIKPDDLMRFALVEYAKSPQLQRCSPESIYLALIACAQVGLAPGGVRQEAFIIPYKNEATFMLGYRGIIALAMRSPDVRKLDSNVVYSNDVFDYDVGSAAFIKHKPALTERGTLIAAYAYALLANGDTVIEIMPLHDLEQIEKHATSGGRKSPAWRDWRDQMLRKAPIRRLGKRLPLGDDYRLAVKLDASAESGDRHGYNDTLRGTGVDIVDAEIVADTGKLHGAAALKERMNR